MITIINNLSKEFYGQLECLGENTEKYITFSVPVSKELDNGKTITYKLKFIDSFRFMSTSLTSLKCTKKNAKDARKKEKSNHYAILLGLKIINYVTNAKNAKKIWLKPINGLIKKFPNIYKFCNGDICFVVKKVCLFI